MDNEQLVNQYQQAQDELSGVADQLQNLKSLIYITESFLTRIVLPPGVDGFELHEASGHLNRAYMQLNSVVVDIQNHKSEVINILVKGIIPEPITTKTANPAGSSTPLDIPF